VNDRSSLTNNAIVGHAMMANFSLPVPSHSSQHLRVYLAFFHVRPIITVKKHPDLCYLLCGRPDAGKSAFMWALYAYAVERNRPAIAISLPELIEDFRQFSREIHLGLIDERPLALNLISGESMSTSLTKFLAFSSHRFAIMCTGKWPPVRYRLLNKLVNAVMSLSLWGYPDEVY